MSRPQKATNDQIFAATQRAMSRHGPGELTLAHIATEAGVTAGALVQRFGSKRELLLAMSAAWSGGSEAFFDDIRAKYPSPLAALRYYAECMAGMAASPASFARNLAYLQIDLTDADFRKHLVIGARATRRGLEAVIRDAIKAGELVASTDAARLARTVEAMIGGSLLTWAHYRQGAAAAWILDDVDAVLEPYLARRTRAKRTARRK